MQLTDNDMNERMLEINEELAQLQVIGNFDISLEEVSPKGSVKVFLFNRDTRTSLSWVIGYSDSLEHIAQTFNAPEYITPRSAQTITRKVEAAYFNDMGRLVLDHGHRLEQEFKVEKKDREKVSLILKERLGNKFKD